MREVGIVLRLPNQRAVVHYVDCVWYRCAVHTHLPLPARTRVVLCLRCRPTEEDIRAAPPEVSWYAWSPGPGRRERITMEEAEDIAARQSMGNGRKLAHRTGWR